MCSDLRALIRDAVEAGFTVATTKKQHIKFTAPNGAIVVTSGTAGDVRTYKNARARLRRVGLNDRDKSRASA